MDKTKKPPENIGSVPLNSGIGSNGKGFGGSTVKGKFVPHETAQLVREQDPTGAIVVHPVRRSRYVHEHLHSAKKLADELYDAAEQFRKDFERAQLSGNYARLDLHKTRAGKGEMSDRVALAKMRVSKALDDLGAVSQSCAWNVVGLGATLEDWTNLIRQNAGHMNADKAAGVFLSVLERLALSYRIVDIGKLTALRQNGAYARAIGDFMEFIDVFSAAAPAAEKITVSRLIASAQKRFQKFAFRNSHED